MKILNSSFEHNGVISFLINTPPLDELDDCIIDIVSKYRAGIIAEVEAVEYIIENKMKFIKEYIVNSLEISEEMRGWRRLAE